MADETSGGLSFQGRYKYANAHEWLTQHLCTITDADALRGAALEFARYLDGDTIQDMYQEQMDADGYFDKILED